MKKISIGIYILVSAIIWGAVIVGCSLKLQGTNSYDLINLILYGGVISHLILIWIPLGIHYRRNDH